MIHISFKPGFVDWREGFVYSVAYDENRSSGGATGLGLARATGFDRSRTVKGIVRELVGKGMMREGTAKHPGLWVLRPPAESVYYIPGKDWWNAGLGYFTMRLTGPGCPLDPAENIVFWKIKNLIASGKDWITADGLATLLGMTIYKAEASLKTLKKCGLITPDGRGFAVPDKLPKWWERVKRPGRGRKPKPEEAAGGTVEAPQMDPPADGNSDPWTGTAWEGLLESILREDVANGWMRKVWGPKILDKLHSHYMDFDKGSHDWNWASHILAKARGQHAKTGQAKSCFALFEKMLDDAIKGAGKGFERMREPEAEPLDPFAEAVAEFERTYEKRTENR